MTIIGKTADVRMVRRCPVCGTETDPANFHIHLHSDSAPTWTYECEGCGLEKPTEEWVLLATKRHEDEQRRRAQGGGNGKPNISVEITNPTSEDEK